MTDQPYSADPFHGNPVPPPTGPPSGNTPSAPSLGSPRRSRKIPLLLAVAGIAVLIAAIMWGVTAGRLSDEKRTSASLRAEVTELSDARTSLEQQVSDMQARDSARQSAEAEVPNLRTIAARHFVSSVIESSDATSAVIRIQTYKISSAAVGLRDMLTELGFSTAVIDRMDSTRALDGTQTAEGDNCNVSWTYHPDDGLRMVFEAAAN